jgi:hypothetical protein
VGPAISAAVLLMVSHVDQGLPTVISTVFEGVAAVRGSAAQTGPDLNSRQAFDIRLHR